MRCEWEDSFDRGSIWKDNGLGGPHAKAFCIEFADGASVSHDNGVAQAQNTGRNTTIAVIWALLRGSRCIVSYPLHQVGKTHS